MNTLSWMIYLAEVAGNAQGFLIAATLSTALALTVATVVFAAAGSVGDAEESAWKKPVRLLWIPTVCGLLSVFVPSTKTLYMIAASETGEVIASTPEAKEMLGDLKDVIRKKLKEELVEKTGT